MSRAALALLLLALGAPAHAQEPEADRIPGTRALKLSVGLGLVAADQQEGPGGALVDVPGSGHGPYAAGEYVLRPMSWFSPRLYGGLLITRAVSDCGPGVQPCDVSASYVFGGGKLRLLLPIPYLAPYFEFGVGFSLGRFSTRSGALVDVRQVGLAYHVPITLGVALGERRQYELAFVYYFHPEQQQVSGAVAIGYQLPLD